MTARELVNEESLRDAMIKVDAGMGKVIEMPEMEKGVARLESSEVKEICWDEVPMPVKSSLDFPPQVMVF